MRIQCDVCERNLASVMCCADEAALCGECDTRIHAANKLANKHVRVSLLAVPESPNCDICQEKRAFFFCSEDRALLCRDCDVSIHTANTLSSNHKRFLITGTRVALEAIKEDSIAAGGEPLSPESPPLASPTHSHSSVKGPCSPLPVQSLAALKAYPAPPPAHHACNHHSQQHPSELKMAAAGSMAASEMHKVVRHEVNHAPKLMMMNHAPPAVAEVPLPLQQLISLPSLGNGMMQSSGLLRKSSISEFLTDTIPGWRVDELLSLSDYTEGFNMGDMGSTKVVGDFDWTADLSLFEEQMLAADAFHEVPRFVPTLAVPSSLPRSTRPAKAGRVKAGKQENLMGPTSFDDTFMVPDLGIPSGQVSPPFPKRKRNFFDI